jgi:hypothetical protein
MESCLRRGFSNTVLIRKAPLLDVEICLVTNGTAHIGVFDRFVRFGAIGFYLNCILKPNLTHGCSKNHIFAGIIPRNRGYWAFLTQLRSPIAAVLGGSQSPAFLKITAAVVVAVEKFTFNPKRRLHEVLPPKRG